MITPAAGAPLKRECVFAPILSHVAQARAFVQTHCELEAFSDEACASAVLIASEVVTNAIVHGRSEARVVVVLLPDGLRFEVSDENSRHPSLVPADVNALDGRGLTIVELLARAWGVRDDPFGKTVWFDISRD